MRAVLAGLFLLLPMLAGAQITLRGTVLDSLTRKPLPFASVFLANTTLGATTTEQGQFTLLNVPAGSYDLVASYVGYRLARQALRVNAATPAVTLVLAPEINRLAEIIVRGRHRRANRPEDYQRFLELFLGRTSFSRQCRILNPRAVLVDYDPKTKVLTASAADYVQVENKALGYAIKYYGLRFTADFAQQVVTFYGQPVFEALTPRNSRQLQRWEANRLTAYRGSLTHFLRSVYDDRVTTEGFLAQRLRIVPNPPFARTDSLRQRLLHRARPIVFSAAEQDSLTRWAKVPASLLLLYTSPRPIDSLRRVATNGHIFLRFTDQLQITYHREPPDPLYPGPAVPLGGHPPATRQQVSRLQLLEQEAELQPGGRLVNPLAVLTEAYWGFEKMGEFLPLNYQPATWP